MTSVPGDSKFIRKFIQRSITFMLKTSSNSEVLEVKWKFEVRNEHMYSSRLEQLSSRLDHGTPEKVWNKDHSSRLGGSRADSDRRTKMSTERRADSV